MTQSKLEQQISKWISEQEYERYSLIKENQTRILFDVFGYNGEHQRFVALKEAFTYNLKYIKVPFDVDSLNKVGKYLQQLRLKIGNRKF